ncbi:P-loop containing nucleoside triphosphate hydrolase protein [Scheffersomyces coipomensis]|uniref:P-loop containing nucleoside triphosphate hydrolase protein n=1 Tax=Scheffersomyces coipomensis TaxID=1788519 RepID=UPI00315DB5F6
MSSIQTGRGKRRRKFEDEVDSHSENEEEIVVEDHKPELTPDKLKEPKDTYIPQPQKQQEQPSRSKYIDEEDISSNDKRRKFDLLHQKDTSTTSRNHKRNDHNQWELEQYQKAQQIMNTTKITKDDLDKVNLPDNDKYEYVFDDSQYVNFNEIEEDDELKGDDQPQKPDLIEKERISIAEVRQSLPVYKFRSHFLEAMDKNQVLIVVGETGSGKTTQLPQYLYEAGYSQGDKNLIIGCTQPRRVAATSVATRVAQEMNVKLGKEVGYSVRFDDKSSKDTVIKYLTDGMLLREFLTDSKLLKYSVIMIDEAHERTLSTEILLSLLKDILTTRHDLKVIIASATINAEKFSNYFHQASILNIPGRRFPVKIHYTKNPEANYIQAAITTIFQIHLTQPLPGDILVFLTGQEEIESMEESLQESIIKLGSSLENHLQVLSIYSNLPIDLQKKIFEPTLPHTRKVILATNIAETSITIDGISYVIDPGYVKQNVYNPTQAMESLVVVPCSKASVDQRAGRAGRIGPGKCFRLFTKWSYYNELDANTTPEILRVNLSSVILLLLSLGINDLINFDFLDKPNSKHIIKSLELLYSLGCINSKGSLTKLGLKLSKFPLDPMLSKCLITSEKFNCVLEIITIISMLGESSTLFYRPKDKQEIASKKHASFDSPLGDHFSLLNVSQQWENSDFSNQWCQEYFVQYKTLRRVKNVRDQLIKLCQRNKINVNETISINPLYIQKSLISGYFPNIVKLSMMGDTYKKLKSSNVATPCYIHPSSSIFKIKPIPKLLLYHELVLTSKEYMRNCMIIDEKLIKEYGSHYYSPQELESLSKTKK